mgnify:CR=1 FL=1
MKPSSSACAMSKARVSFRRWGNIVRCGRGSSVRVAAGRSVVVAARHPRVALQRRAEDLDDVVGAVTERLGDAEAIDHYGVDDLTLGRRVVYDVAANWKLIVENFMECYHCATIHPELTEVLPEFAGGLAAQYFVGHGAAFGDEVQGFTIDGSAGFESVPGLAEDHRLPDRLLHSI